MRACSSSHDQYWRNVVTVLLVYFQALIEAFRGHSRESCGRDTVIHHRWEELVFLASQRGSFSIHGMPRVVVLIFWPLGRKIRFSLFSLFRGWTSFRLMFLPIKHASFFTRTGTENCIHSPGTSRWRCKARGASADDLKFGDYGNGAILQNLHRFVVEWDAHAGRDIDA